MKKKLGFILCFFSFFTFQSNLLAEKLTKAESVQTKEVSESMDDYEILTITGPTVIEVNTVNVYGFAEFNSLYYGLNYHYQWTLLCAEYPATSPFYMGYNTSHTCSFICYEPVNLFLWLDVYDSNNNVAGHAETTITVLPAGSLNP